MNINKSTDLTESQVIAMLSEFYKDPIYEELRRIYMTKSFPEILSIDRREMSHSAFLAWLLDEGESHGLGSFPMLQFLKILVRRDLLQNRERHDKKVRNNTSTGSIATDIINENIQFEKIKISLERPAKTGKTKGRIDILIDGTVNICNGEEKTKNRDFHIVIENKVYSSEHDNQTQTYFESKKEEIKGNSIFLFVYLTPLAKSELDSLLEPQCYKEYIQINYQDILDEILEPALGKDISLRSKFIIEEYIHCLSLPALSADIKDNNYNPNSIMATTKKVTAMLNTFWNKHEQLITAALDILRNETEDSELKEQLDSTLNAIAINTRRKKDKTHYDFCGKHASGKYALLSIAIPIILEEAKITPAELSKDYKETIGELSGTNDLYNTIKNYLENEGTEMTCPTPEELANKDKFLNNLKKNDLVYTDKDYEEKWKNEKSQGRTKEVYKKEGKIHIFNQWGYDSIDYFIYAYYMNREKWNMNDKKIKVIKQL